MPPPTGVVSGPLMPTRYSLNASTVSSGSQLLNFLKPSSPAKTSNQEILRLAAVGLLHRRVEHAHAGRPDVRPGAVAADEGDDGIIRNGEGLAPGNFFAFGRSEIFVSHRGMNLNAKQKAESGNAEKAQLKMWNVD